MNIKYSDLLYWFYHKRLSLLFFILRFKYRKSLVRKINRHNSVNKNFSVKLLWKPTAIFYASRLYVIQTIKKSSIADISINFMLFTIYKEIWIGFAKLLNQYKQKTDKIQNMTIYEKISRIPEISRKLASLYHWRFLNISKYSSNACGGKITT